MANSSLIRIEVPTDVRLKIGEVIERLQDGREMFKEIAGALEAEAKQNFAEQGRPDWLPLKPSTVRARGQSVLKVLQDHGTLASSLSTEYGPDFALIGTNVRYAATHQFGATINRAARSIKVRLRTDAKGNLMRQGEEGSAKGRAVFARWNGSNPHKRYRETWAQVDAYQIDIPARPFLPFKGAELQPEAAQTVGDILTKFLSAAFE